MEEMENTELPMQSNLNFLISASKLRYLEYWETNPYVSGAEMKAVFSEQWENSIWEGNS